ncbi:MAG: hypothetical protein ACFFB0_12710 [Promethearchaeota archaeon]
MKSKSLKNVKFLLTIIFLFILSLNIFTVILSEHQKVYFNSSNSFYNNELEFRNNLHISAAQLTKKTYVDQWIENSDFNNNTNWISEITGDKTDITTDINEGVANFNVEGASYTETLISGTPNSSTSENWYNTTNPDIPVYPTQGYGIDESGCFASHLWAEHSGTTTNAYQKTSVQWEKVITAPHNLSDYTITDVSLDLLINATAKAYEGGNDLDIWSWEGVEVYGDTYARFNEGDYIKFYVRFLNLDKTVNYKVFEYQTSTLGQDGDKVLDSYDYLYDVLFEANNTSDLIFYLNQVLENGDYQNFIIALGMEFNCEDNQVTDLDEFTEAYIKSCNFTISYIKKINRLTSASWKYLGNKIDNRGGIVEINNANLQFDFKINKDWPTNLSPNSEIRILINDKEHTEAIGLRYAEEKFIPAKAEGFEVGTLIPIADVINISILIFLGDEFNLAEDLIISIDNVKLNISYDIFLPTKGDTLFIGLLIGALISSILLGGYFIYYRMVLRFPKQVRKVRKYRKTLNKKEPPKITIKNREKSFGSNYNKEIKKTSSLTNLKHIKKAVPKKQNAHSMKENPEFFKKLVLVLFIILGLLFIPIYGYLVPNSYITEEKTMSLNLLQVGNSNLFRKVSHNEQWIENPNFDTSDNWSLSQQGDFSDLSLDISDGSGNYEILGDYGKQDFLEDGTSSNWTKLQNEDNIVLPDNFTIGDSGMNESGWYAYFFWPDNEPQSVRVQWRKNFSMSVNMSDYYITSASLKTWINGSVQATSMDNGGIDRPGDTLVNNPSNELQIATGDFARYFIMISDIEQNREFVAAQYQTDELGKDGPPAITQLNDTLIMPINEETLVFYLEQALQYDHQHFAITLGMYFWCEDSGHPGDSDNWQMMIIKNFSLSISYEKKINQFNSGTWKYRGKRIEANGYRVEVTDAQLNFEYKVDQTWPSDLSPNSRFKISINEVEHNETIRLSEADTSFKNATENGFDVGKIIPNDKEINVSIQVYIADEFALRENIKISIDNIYLWISYDVYIPVKESILFQALFILACIGAGILAAYTILYQRVLKYPRQVRKVRKYRKTLRQEKIPEVPILSQEEAFKRRYNQVILKTTQLLTAKLMLRRGESIESTEKESKLLKTTYKKLEKESNSEELITKSLEKKEELDKIVKKLSKESN